MFICTHLLMTFAQESPACRFKVEDYYARDTFQKMKAFADTQETPFVVIDTAMISQAYDDLRAGFEFAKVYYAVKANPAVEIIDLLRDKGSNFDIASIYELDKVMAQRRQPGPHQLRQHHQEIQGHPLLLRERRAPVLHRLRSRPAQHRQGRAGLESLCAHPHRRLDHG
jgi:hypothetical protein